MRKIFTELLERYQVRKSRSEKDAFITYVQNKCEELDYPCNVEILGTFKSRNIVVGNLNTAKTIFTAHYDTQAVMPFPNFITPLNIPVFVLYNIVLAFAMFFIAFVTTLIFTLVTNSTIIGQLANLVVLLLLFWQMMFGVSNKHTANDNTSGCAALLAIMEDLPSDFKNSAAFVFFDHEEVGLLGSAAFSKKYNNILQSKLLVNMDCISDGENLLFVSKKDSHNTPLENALTNALRKHTELSDMNFIYAAPGKALYPSDQANFKNACALAALNKNKFVGYYLARIHTPKDVIFEERNLECITAAAVEYIGNISA